jgi:hypothetical protein
VAPRGEDRRCPDRDGEGARRRRPRLHGRRPECASAGSRVRPRIPRSELELGRDERPSTLVASRVPDLGWILGLDWASVGGGPSGNRREPRDSHYCSFLLFVAVLAPATPRPRDRSSPAKSRRPSSRARSRLIDFRIPSGPRSIVIGIEADKQPRRRRTLPRRENQCPIGGIGGRDKERQRDGAGAAPQLKKEPDATER